MKKNSDPLSGSCPPVSSLSSTVYFLLFWKIYFNLGIMERSSPKMSSILIPELRSSKRNWILVDYTPKLFKDFFSNFDIEIYRYLSTFSLYLPVPASLAPVIRIHNTRKKLTQLRRQIFMFCWFSKIFGSTVSGTGKNLFYTTRPTNEPRKGPFHFCSF